MGIAHLQSGNSPFSEKQEKNVIALRPNSICLSGMIQKAIRGPGYSAGTDKEAGREETWVGILPTGSSLLPN